MKKDQILALTIISLCALSIIVGIISPFKKSHNPCIIETGQSSSDFNQMFSPNNKIALIELQGEITSDSQSSLFGDDNSAESIKKSLEKALQDKSVKGILLRINSPGGTVGISQEINNLILRIREKKPVVVSMEDLAASGGYYIASAADRIYANPGTLTGSVGVVIHTFNAQNLFNNKLGIQSDVIKSGKFKDITSPYRSMTKDEKDMLQKIIDTTYNQFVNAIEQGRINRTDSYSVAKVALTKQNLMKYADGRVFTGEQAKQYGFIDETGDLSAAEQAAKQMAKEKFNLVSSNLPVVPYNRASAFSEFLFSTSQSLFSGKNLPTSAMPFSMKYPNKPLLIYE